MNRLRKKAWEDLIRVFIVMMIIIPGSIVFAVYGIPNKAVVPVMLLGGIFGGIVGHFARKKKYKKMISSFDERELILMKKAGEWGQEFFISYLFGFIIIGYLIYDNKGKIQVSILPIICFTGLFLAQCVYSAVLLRYAKEDDE